MWIEKWCHHSTVFDNTGSFSHIFADDACIIAHDEQAAATLGADFADFLLDFSIEVHIGSANNAKPKTVALFIPSTSPVPHAPPTTWPEGPTAILKLHPALRDPNKLPRFVLSMARCRHRIANDLSSKTHMTERISKATQLFGALRKNFFGSKKRVGESGIWDFPIYDTTNVTRRSGMLHACQGHDLRAHDDVPPDGA